MTDMVNHPPHYERHKITLEPIDILESVPFAVANVFKYIIRAQDKGNELEDLKKALWYLRRAQERELLRKEDGSRFLVFKFSDIPMLRLFARNIEDFGMEAWDSLEYLLGRKIERIEGGKNESN